MSQHVFKNGEQSFSHLQKQAKSFLSTKHNKLKHLIHGNYSIAVHEPLGISFRGHRTSIHIPITKTSPTTPSTCQPRPCSLYYQHAPTFTFQHRHSLALQSPFKPSMTSAASQDHRPLHALQQTEGYRFRRGYFAAGIWDKGFLCCVRQSNYEFKVMYSVTGIGDKE